MTTRREVLGGLAGIAAAVMVPVSAIDKAARAVSYNPGNVGDIVLKWDGTLWRIDCAFGGTWGLTQLCAGDLVEGEEYTFLIHDGKDWCSFGE